MDPLIYPHSFVNKLIERKLVAKAKNHPEEDLTFEGIGLHSGKLIRTEICPAEPTRG